MRKFICLWFCLFLLAGCSSRTTETPADTTMPVLERTSATDIPTKPSITLPPTSTPTLPPSTITPIPTPLNRPVFLSWPLPESIGVQSISQYPNTPWTWKFLGLNQGYTCPPLNSSIKDPDLEQYWRDTFLDEEEDAARADPNGFGVIACYSNGEVGHSGTDIAAPAKTAVFAAAEGRVAGWRDDHDNSMLILKHCVFDTWLADGSCDGGQLWYTTYLHILPEGDLLKSNRRVVAGTQIGVVYNQGQRSHLHFEVGVEDRSNRNYRNPWGADAPPWGNCLWIDSSICSQPGED